MPAHPISRHPPKTHLPPTRATPVISPQPTCLLFPLYSPPSLSAPCSSATDQARPDPWPSPSAQLWSVDGRPWRERRASSSTSLFGDARTALRTCASQAMVAFCRAAGWTFDRRHDQLLAQLLTVVSSASSCVFCTSHVQHRGCTVASDICWSTAVNHLQAMGTGHESRTSGRSIVARRPVPLPTPHSFRGLHVMT